ncbi:acyl-CoA carboxylase subunit epsilon [Streptomyces sp. NPDC050856]|uniref:acyl-CoA carboxylase subunit epsilon n=1 Tax=Streptomyces sp. NPDC050856 TaxID=3154939 RepID=UPI0033F879B0
MPHHLRIVHGRPNAAEVAALTAVLTALASRAAAQPPQGSDRDTRRADWDRRWRAHPPSGSWRSRLSLATPHYHR